MNTELCRQVVVGVDGSIPSLQALRQAVREARARDAQLTVVHVYHLDAAVDVIQLTCQREARVAMVTGFLSSWLDEALGGPPPGLPLRGLIVEGATPGRALVAQVHGDDDLLVVGTDGRQRWRPRWSASVGEYCTRRAPCPVLVVPPPQLARDLGRRGRLRWRKVGRELAEDLRSVRPAGPHPAPPSGGLGSAGGLG